MAITVGEFRSTIGNHLLETDQWQEQYEVIKTKNILSWGYKIQLNVV